MFIEDSSSISALKGHSALHSGYGSSLFFPFISASCRYKCLILGNDHLMIGIMIFNMGEIIIEGQTKGWNSAK